MCARTFWRMKIFLLENFLPHGYLNSQLSVIEFLFTLEVNLSTNYFSLFLNFFFFCLCCFLMMKFGKFTLSFVNLLPLMCLFTLPHVKHLDIPILLIGWLSTILRLVQTYGYTSAVIGPNGYSQPTFDITNITY
jgi:hypothetical protein